MLVSFESSKTLHVSHRIWQVTATPTPTGKVGDLKRCQSESEYKLQMCGEFNYQHLTDILKSTNSENQRDFYIMVYVYSRPIYFTFKGPEYLFLFVWTDCLKCAICETYEENICMNLSSGFHERDSFSDYLFYEHKNLTV